MKILNTKPLYSFLEKFFFPVSAALKPDSTYNIHEAAVVLSNSQVRAVENPVVKHFCWYTVDWMLILQQQHLYMFGPNCMWNSDRAPEVNRSVKLWGFYETHEEASRFFFKTTSDETLFRFQRAAALDSANLNL